MSKNVLQLDPKSACKKQFMVLLYFVYCFFRVPDTNVRNAIFLARLNSFFQLLSQLPSLSAFSQWAPIVD